MHPVVTNGLFDWFTDPIEEVLQGIVIDVFVGIVLVIILLIALVLAFTGKPGIAILIFIIALIAGTVYFTYLTMCIGPAIWEYNNRFNILKFRCKETRRM